MSLDDLRKNNENNKLANLIKAFESTSLGKKNYDNQETTYYPERDKKGNGSAIIRFLPGLESEGYPLFIERFQHGFKFGPKWFINYCPTTIEKDCPVCNWIFDEISKYGDWKDVPKNIQDKIRKMGRMSGYGAGYYCNILVIKDPANPENEGKVHLFKFGKGILNMIMDMGKPEDDGLGNVRPPINVFDLEEGANFKFIIRKKEGMANYDKCEFEKPSPCPDFDHDSQFSLLSLKKEELFKDYETLEKEFIEVMKYDKSVAVPSTPANTDSSIIDEESVSTGDDVPVDMEANNDDNLDYFRKLAQNVSV